MKKNIVICDIDGTITKVGDRTKYIKTDPKDWDAFYTACGEDKPNRSIINLLCFLSLDCTIIFFSGRRESCRVKTEKWIGEHFPLSFMYAGLFLRSDGDGRPDVEVKPEFLDDILDYDKKQILCFIEDRTCMVKKWRELGYTCLQVADGDY
jgi:hypothetical protein